MKIVLSSTIEKIATKVDGTITISISTQELDPTQAGQVFGLRGKFCKVLLSDSNITNLEEELVDKEVIASGKKNKTHSQRLRNTLFVYFEQKGFEMDFEQFYNNEMEKIISHYKSKLE
jgi:hypothetical protein